MCRDVEYIAKSLREVISHGYSQTETDMFVARAMLELIARCDNFELALRLRKEYFSDVHSPIINFVEMLPEVIDIGVFGLLQELIKKYESQINRDPAFMNVSIGTSYIYRFLTE